MKSKLLLTIIFLLIFFSAFINESGSAKINKKSDQNIKTNVNKKIDTNNKSDIKNTSTSSTYTVPPRMILVSPYVSYIYANNLFENTIKDQSGFGAGLNIRFQIYKEFGFMLDGLYTNLEIEKVTPSGLTEQNNSDLVAVFAGGFYYSFFFHSLTDLRLDIAYGAITAGDNVMTIFMPGIELFLKISNRITLFTKLSCLITNDWIVNQDYKEHYTSYSLSAGLTIVF
jgi:hypothetical protein